MSSSLEGEPGKLRIVWYHITRDRQAKKWEEHEHQVFDLTYEDGKYFLYYEQDGETITEEYAALKCFSGDYHKQEWFLLGESFLETDYRKLMKNAFSFQPSDFILEDWIEGTSTWKLIYFSEEELL